MSCKVCGDYGAVEYVVATSAQFTPGLAQCPECKDVSKYSEIIKTIKKYGFITQAQLDRVKLCGKADEEHFGNVIPFRRKNPLPISK